MQGLTLHEKMQWIPICNVIGSRRNGHFQRKIRRVQNKPSVGENQVLVERLQFLNGRDRQCSAEKHTSHGQGRMQRQWKPSVSPDLPIMFSLSVFIPSSREDNCSVLMPVCLSTLEAKRTSDISCEKIKVHFNTTPILHPSWVDCFLFHSI